MRQAGYTLLELMVTIAVLSIVIAVVVPGARDLVNHTRLSSEINELSSMSRLARFKAMDEQSNVIVCPTKDFSSCSTNWTYGKMACVDINDDGTRNSNEAILASTEIMNGSLKIFAPSQSLVFDRRGGANVTTTITLCDTTLKASAAVGLIINGYGKIAIAADSDDDGIKENHAGNKLACS